MTSVRSAMATPTSSAPGFWASDSVHRAVSRIVGGLVGDFSINKHLPASDFFSPDDLLLTIRTRREYAIYMLTGWGVLEINAVLAVGLPFAFLGRWIDGSHGFDIGVDCGFGICMFCLSGMAYAVWLWTNLGGAQRRIRRTGSPDAYATELIRRSQPRNASLGWQAVIGVLALGAYLFFVRHGI